MYFTSFLLVTVILYSYSKLQPEIHHKLRVGTTISVFGGLNGLTYESLEKAKKAGVDCIEITLTGYVNGENPIPDEELKKIYTQVKKDADAAGIEIWSIHMPYGQDCDPSQTDEKIRQKSIKLYKNYLDIVKVLKPKVILFHPSWRLGLNERTQRKEQLIRSAKELNVEVKKIGCIMVFENLLGYKLLRSPGVERPLCRTKEEMLDIMNQMPNDIYAAVDMNHIQHPEELIKALGSRVKSVHICDGDGIAECHVLPGRGDNNWNLILQALDEVGYNGPFLYEIKGREIKEFRELKDCYDKLYLESLVSH